MHCLVFTDSDLYSLTKGKAYLANPRWRRSTCLRDQCYDVGCHPCRFIFEYNYLIIFKNKMALGPWVAHLIMTDQWSGTICENLESTS